MASNAAAKVAAMDTGRRAAAPPPLSSSSSIIFFLCLGLIWGNFDTIAYPPEEPKIQEKPMRDDSLKEDRPKRIVKKPGWLKEYVC